MSVIKRSLSSKKYDSKINDNSDGSVELSTSHKVQITGLVIRRLFKTLSCDFDVPLDAVISIRGADGSVLGKLDLSENLEPSKDLYEGLKVAAKNYLGFGIFPVPDFAARAAFNGYLNTFSSECTPKEIKMIMDVYENPSELKNPPAAARDDRLGTVPMASGHYGHYDFKSPIVLEKDKVYEIHANVRRRGWYKILHEESETVKCDGVEFKFGRKSNSFVVNSFLSGFKFVKM